MDTSKRKPNLMTASRGAPDQGQRILASLEHGGKPVAPPRRTAARQLDSWIVGVCALVVVLAAVAWTMRDRPVAPARQVQAVPASIPVSAEPPAPQAAGNQAAAIINEPAVSERHTAHAAAPVPTAAPATSAPVHATAKAAPPHAISAAPRTATAARTAASAPAGASADTDVALLTALVAHAGQPATVTPERSRDVVERRDGDSTETLLARCKQLGLIEGMLCRSRICSGRWETDAACRAPNH